MEPISTEKAPVLAMSFPHTGAHGSPQVPAPTITTKPTLTYTGQTPTPSPQQAPPQVPPPLVKETSDTDVSEANMDLQANSLHSDELMSTENRRDMRQFQRHQSKERTIEQVLEKGKILRVSRRLRTRLEYAILKIRRGWSKYTLQEVESLTQPACSPRLSKRPVSSAYNSPRQSHRKRTKRSYPDYEELPYKDPSDEDENKDVIMQMAHLSSSRQSSPTRQYRSRPSFSQFKDSELFLPAKSLMDIATSSPSFQEASASPYSHQPPGTASPYGYGSPGPLYRESTPVRDSPRGWSTLSSPSTPVSSVMETNTHDEEPEEGAAPSAAQAARTILMLSSPTRPPPRTLHQGYIVEMNSSPTHSPITEWSGPYSPMVSSPLVHFQTAASTPSPDRRESPQTGHSDISSQAEEVSNPPSSRTPQPKTFAGYGSTNRYEPSSPSPLSASLFPSHESVSRSASPTMKRAAKFAAAATLASQESKLAEKAFIQGGGEHNTTSEIVVPGSQPGMDYQQQLPQHPQQPQQTQMYGGPLKEEHLTSRAVTPPPRPETFHGMRTPPPSVGTEIDMSHYASGHGAKVLTRRNSGLAGDTDLSALYLRRNTNNPPRAPQ